MATNTLASKLAFQPGSMKGKGFNFAPFTVVQGQATPGQQFYEKIGGRKELGQSIYDQYRNKVTGRVAEDLAQKSAFQIPMDEFNRPVRKLTNFRDLLGKRTQEVTERGKIALEAEEQKAAWHAAKQLQDLNAYGFGPPSDTGTGSSIPGASASNVGAKAIDLAMKAMRNGTPYVWGGNSLTRGVDCSALVQQVYGQLGIKVPRVTYDQARHGKKVNLNSMRPGDLVFFRPGSRGPEHVGIFIGNGKFIHAANSKLGIIISNVWGSSNGSPMFAVRPY